MSDHLGLSAEDRFALVNMASPDSLFPHPFFLANFSYAAAQLGRKWEFLWDFRSSSEGVYEDVLDAFRETDLWPTHDRRTVLALPSNVEEVREALKDANDANDRGISVMAMRANPLPFHPLDLAPFDEDSDAILDSIDFAKLIHEGPSLGGLPGLPAKIESKFGPQAAMAQAIAASDNDRFDEAWHKYALEEAEDWAESAGGEEESLDLPETMAVQQEMGYARSGLLSRFLDSIASNSMLVELALIRDHDRVLAVPYHAHSSHHVVTREDGLVLVRPARVAWNYLARFSEEIEELESLLNVPRVRESEIERLLRRNPLFLRGLNYREVYHQVVLPREGRSHLRPDIIAEPMDSEWADIIDLKLPSQKILVGKENRACLASALTSAEAQLREYHAYFDDRRTAAMVEKKYGFRCLKPRMVVIVGRDPQGMDADEMRRAMTAHPNLEIVSYDRLLQAAKTTLLL